jgi:hypothetical protein
MVLIVAMACLFILALALLARTPARTSALPPALQSLVPAR